MWLWVWKFGKYIAKLCYTIIYLCSFFCIAFEFFTVLLLWENFIYVSTHHAPQKYSPSSHLFVARMSSLDRAHQYPSHCIAPFFSISVYRDILIENSQTCDWKSHFMIILSWYTEIEKNGAMQCDGYWYALSNELILVTNRGELLGLYFRGAWWDTESLKKNAWTIVVPPCRAFLLKLIYLF